MRATLPPSAGVCYRPMSHLAARIDLVGDLRRAVIQARATVPASTSHRQRGRLTRCNDVARGRPLDLRSLAACIAELRDAGAEREAVLAIGEALTRWIDGQWPATMAPALEEAQRTETITDGLLDEAQLAAAAMPSSPARLDALLVRITQQFVSLRDLWHAARRHRRVAT
jgi:hypothetical protein